MKILQFTSRINLTLNLRAEAEYTFNIRKKYIPLIMQADYKPDGWLGLILGITYLKYF